MTKDVQIDLLQSELAFAREERKAANRLYEEASVAVTRRALERFINKHRVREMTTHMFLPVHPHQLNNIVGKRRLELGIMMMNLLGPLRSNEGTKNAHEGLVKANILLPIENFRRCLLNNTTWMFMAFENRMEEAMKLQPVLFLDHCDWPLVREFRNYRNETTRWGVLFPRINDYRARFRDSQSAVRKLALTWARGEELPSEPEDDMLKGMPVELQFGWLVR